MGSVNVNSFVDGVPPIHLANAENIKKLGDWGKKKYPGGSSSSIPNLQFSEI